MHSYQIQDITQEEIQFYFLQISKSIFCELFHAL